MFRSVASHSTSSEVSCEYEARRFTTLGSSCPSRRKSAPVNGAMYGTPAAAAIGVAARDVGVPTAPMRAKTRSSSISFRVLTIAASGSYESSAESNSSRRPCTPPASFASPKAAITPARNCWPSCPTGPLNAADCPNRMRSWVTPCSSARIPVAVANRTASGRAPPRQSKRASGSCVWRS